MEVEKERKQLWRENLCVGQRCGWEAHGSESDTKNAEVRE